MEFLSENADVILKLIAALVGAGFAVLKATEKGKAVAGWLKARKMQKAFALCVNVCTQIYDETVRTLKANGKFDAKAKAKVKAQAIEILKTQFAENGLGILKDLIPVLIEDAVSYLKGKGKLPFSAELLPELP